jgi:hypothetical protein
MTLRRIAFSGHNRRFVWFPGEGANPSQICDSSVELSHAWARWVPSTDHGDYCPQNLLEAKSKRSCAPLRRQRCVLRNHHSSVSPRAGLRGQISQVLCLTAAGELDLGVVPECPCLPCMRPRSPASRCRPRQAQAAGSTPKEGTRLRTRVVIGAVSFSF